MGAPSAVARRVRTRARRTASNSWLEFLERCGYVIRGATYAVMGGLALGLALGIGGAATDQSGSVVILSEGPAGRVLLCAVVIGLGAYSIWGFVRAIYDPLHRGEDASGIAERLGFAWSGTAYAAIVIFALHLLAGSGASAAHDSTQAAIARVLSYPAGHVIAMAIGIVTVGIGLGQFVDAYRAIFKQDLKRVEMKAAEKRVVDMLGRFGYFSRGVTFTLVGWFVFQGGLHHDSSQVRGYNGVFLFLLGEPFGRLVLGVVALGFIALGLHSLACARWIKLLGTRQ
ncbi:MAG TPA: DUF1206 domain-containing protein [Candidatus Dormibacteraeota bacterium]|nr:DUF1206 domain-containing protein [Candidatus Dormibacteraeota bacterium]